MSTPFFFEEAGGKCYPAFNELEEIAGCTANKEFMLCSDCGLAPRCPGHGAED
jgi:hypothetical protein